MSQINILAVICSIGKALISYGDLCRSLGLDPEANSKAMAQEIAAMFEDGIDFPWWRIIATDGSILSPYTDIHATSVQATLIQKEFPHSVTIYGEKVLFLTKATAFAFNQNKFRRA